jgi:hypothetical protein
MHRMPRSRHIENIYLELFKSRSWCRFIAGRFTHTRQSTTSIVPRRYLNEAGTLQRIGECGNAGAAHLQA